jgi:hypothetical protein
MIGLLAPSAHRIASFSLDKGFLLDLNGPPKQAGFLKRSDFSDAMADFFAHGNVVCAHFVVY